MKSLLITLVFIVLTYNASAQKTTLVVPQGNASNIDQMTTSADGSLVATAAYKSIVIWDALLEKQLYSLEMKISSRENKNISLQFSSDNKNVLIGTSNGAFYYNIQTGDLICELSVYYPVTLSPDNQQIVSIENNNLNIYNALTGKYIRQIANVGTQIDYGDPKIYWVEPDRIITLNRFNWCIVNTETGKSVQYKKPDTRAISTFYDNTSGKIVIASENDLDLYDALSGNLIKSKTFTTTLQFVVSSGKGVFVFENDYEKRTNVVGLYSLSDLSLIKKTIDPPFFGETSIYWANSATGLPSGKVAYNDFKILKVYDPGINKTKVGFSNRIADFKSFYYGQMVNQHPFPDSVFNIGTEDAISRSFNPESYRPGKIIPIEGLPIYSPDGKRIAGIGKQITVADNITGKIIKKIPLPPGIESHYYFFFDKSGMKIFIENGMSKYLGVLDISSGTFTRYLNTPETFVTGKSASSDGRYFACIIPTENGIFRCVYDMDTKKQLVQQAGENGNATVHFLGQSHYYLITSVDKNEFRIYSATDLTFERKIATTFPLKYLGYNHAKGIIAMGREVIYQVASYDISLYDIEGKKNQEITSLNNEYFMSAQFADDGKIMYTPTTKKGVQVWKTISGELLGTYYFIEKTNEFVFVSPESLFDGSAIGMAELYFVNNNNVITLDRFFERFYTPDLLRRKINGERFDPPQIDGLIKMVNVKILYTEKQRNTNDNAQYSNSTGLAELTVVAAAPDDLVEEIRLFHNGKIVNLATRGLFVTENDGSDSKKYTVNLLPGINTFRAVAINSQRTESKPDEITVTFNSGNQPSPVNPLVPGNSNIDPVDRNATLHLVVVGINKYQNPSMSLNYALADATAFKQELEKDAKTILTNISTHFVTDDMATRKGIQDAFQNVKQSAKPQDVFVFYYAGHGVIGKDKEFYLVPNDVSNLKNVQAELEQKGLAAKLMQQYAIDIPAQKQLFILDACQSAGAFEAMLSNDGDQQKSIAVVARSTGTHWMAASGAQQYANEFSQLGHGAFTYVLLEALKGSAAANKMITVNGLKSYLQQGVPELMKKYSGTLQYPASYGFGNDFPVEIVK
jgi:hypothetical protein